MFTNCAKGTSSAHSGLSKATTSKSILRTLQWHRVVWQVPVRQCYVSYHLTVAGPSWQATSLSPPWEPQISFYDTRPVLEISAKIWLIWDCKFRYLIVCASSLIVSVSVTGSEGAIVCLWLRSELLTAVTCLPCWDVTPCSLLDMCQECNWEQGNQTILFIMINPGITIWKSSTI